MSDTVHGNNRRLVWGLIIGISLGVGLNKALEWPEVHAGGKSEVVPSSITDQAEMFRKAARRIAPSVVNIQTYRRVVVAERAPNLNGYGMFYRGRFKKGWSRAGIGSGFVIDAKNGYILTNNHVIDGAQAFEVSFQDKHTLKATLVGRDPKTDIAILKVIDGTLKSAVLGDSEKVQVGDWVLATGNPFGMLEQTVTAGIISAKGRRGLGLNAYEDFLQTDAAINRGNSGGPLVNIQGEVIGVNTAIFSKSGGYQGIGFAIPINQARKIAMQLIENGKIIRGWMGVVLKGMTDKAAQTAGVKPGSAMQVEGVYRNGPAFMAEVRPGDVIVKFNGKSIQDGTQVGLHVADMKPGTVVTLDLLRFGKPVKVNVILEKQPDNFGIQRK